MRRFSRMPDCRIVRLDICRQEIRNGICQGLDTSAENDEPCECCKHCRYCVNGYEVVE